MDTDSKTGFLERISTFLLREPEDREQLLYILHAAFERNLLDSDALSIIEGALSASETRVAEVMVPRSQMNVVDIRADSAAIRAIVVDTAHSRFPVIDGDRDNIIGILLAKDLLRGENQDNGGDFDLRDALRPVVYIPESKRLNVLLREFRVSRNHMAIVVNEYGGVAGLVTIEDVLEQIVGDIEDEYDFDEAHDNIRRDATGRFRVKARTELIDFNAAFQSHFPDDEFSTVGGLVLHHFGRVPKRNESIDIDGFRFQVLRADSRRLYTLWVNAQPIVAPDF